jgi:hypothetical protein
VMADKCMDSEIAPIATEYYQSHPFELASMVSVFRALVFALLITVLIALLWWSAAADAQMLCVT